MRRWTTLSAVVGSGVLAGLLLAGCGAGQQAQTAYQDSTKLGVNTTSLDGKIALRDVHVKYSPEYRAGGNAPIVLRIFNESGQLANLTSVTSSGGDVVVVSRVAPTTAPVTPSATPSASASPNGSRRPNGSASASASAAPTSAGPTTPPPLGTPNISIPVPVDSFVALVPAESDRWLAVDKLKEDLKVGGHLVLTFTFTYADGSTTRVSEMRVPMGVPFSPAPRITPSGAGEH